MVFGKARIDLTEMIVIKISQMAKNESYLDQKCKRNSESDYRRLNSFSNWIFQTPSLPFFRKVKLYSEHKGEKYKFEPGQEAFNPYSHW